MHSIPLVIPCIIFDDHGDDRAEVELSWCQLPPGSASPFSLLTFVSCSKLSAQMFSFPQTSGTNPALAALLQRVIEAHDLQSRMQELCGDD